MATLDKEILKSRVEKLSIKNKCRDVKLEIQDRDGEILFKSDTHEYQQHFIASSTKLFILAAVIKSKILDFSTKAIDVLPEEELRGLNQKSGKDYFNQFTLGDLLGHRTGIPDYYKLKKIKSVKNVAEITKNDPGWSYQDVLEMTKQLEPPFGLNASKAHYSGTNYQLLGRILEESEGEPLSSVLKKSIFDPLDLRETYLFTNQTLSRFEEVSPILFGTSKYLGAKRMASVGAEGAIISSTADSLKFLRALFTSQFIPENDLNKAMLHFVKIFPFIDYGLGIMKFQIPWFLNGFKTAPIMFGHAGATGHFMYWLRDKDIFVAGTVNQLKDRSTSLSMLTSVLKALKD
jgi:D-alanyl-D-alanine carboxypeptidase